MHVIHRGVVGCRPHQRPVRGSERVSVDVLGPVAPAPAPAPAPALALALALALAPAPGPWVGRQHQANRVRAVQTDHPGGAVPGDLAVRVALQDVPEFFFFF